MEKKQSHSQSDSQEEQIFNQPEDYITDPQQYLDYCLKDKKIKVMDQINPIHNQVYIKDISLHKKGPMEDKIYSKMDSYYHNIRRGNTLCQIYHPNQQQNKNQQYDLFFCRRGMKKFYDLEPEYLKVGAHLSHYHYNVKKRIFKGIEEELLIPNTKVHLYCLFKENGQHCQISYLKELESWLFASKNVTVIARDTDELEQHYHKERFIWAKIIGRDFFKVLAKMPAQTRQNFKKDIDGFTLLGEHCGNQEHQHITKYSQVEIIFYGLVKNIGKQHCQPVEQCRNFLNKYALKMSACKRERKNLADKNSILSTMWELLRAVGEGTMAEQGEGSVMYVVAERDGQQRTIGMCKLKTSEYLIYRRLRQMLKLNVSRKSTANTFTKFKFQIEELVKHYFKPPKELDYYFELGEKAFRQCTLNGQIDQTYLRYKFVDFLAKFEEEKKNQKNQPAKLEEAKRIIIVCLPRISNAVEKYCRSRGYEVETMFRPGRPITKTVVHILYMIPRLPQTLEVNCQLVIPQYSEADIDQCISELEQCKDLSRSQLITFVKSQDKQKAVKMLHDKIQGFRKSCIDNKMKINKISWSQEGLISIIRDIAENYQMAPLKKDKIQTGPTKTFLLPLLIPGSGKSTLAKCIREQKKSKNIWKIIDSDALRRQLMETVQQVDLDSGDSNKIFVQTGAQALNEFNKQLTKQAEKQPEKDECVFLDRIFSPLNIEQAIQILYNIKKDYIKIVILTQSFCAVKLNDKSYPYSLNYLLTCLRRCIERPDHQTMPNDPYEVAKIVIKFYQMMSNFNPKIFLKKFEVKIVQLPLIEDNEQNKLVNQQVRKKVEECLSRVEPGHQAKDCESFIQLVECMYKFNEEKQIPSYEKYPQLFEILEASITGEANKF